MKYTFDILDYQVFDSYERYYAFRDKNKSEYLLSNSAYKLKASSNMLTLYNAKGESLWDKPVTFPGRPYEACISEDRLLITTLSEDYHAWGHLGPAFMLDLATGAQIKEIRGSHGKALSGGKFIIGLEGYDVFDTWLYNKQGEMMQQWRSCGHYVIGENDDIIVIEQDRNGPTNSRVVRLYHDGKIERGPKLRTASASYPIKFSNGDIVFENSGILRVIDNSLTEVAELELLKIPERYSSLYYSIIKKEGSLILVKILERTVKERTDRRGRYDPIGYKTHEWKIKVDSNV